MAAPIQSIPITKHSYYFNAQLLLLPLVYINRQRQRTRLNVSLSWPFVNTADRSCEPPTNAFKYERHLLEEQYELERFSFLLQAMKVIRICIAVPEDKYWRPREALAATTLFAVYMKSLLSVRLFLGSLHFIFIFFQFLDFSP